MMSSWEEIRKTIQKGKYVTVLDMEKSWRGRCWRRRVWGVVSGCVTDVTVWWQDAVIGLMLKGKV